MLLLPKVKMFGTKIYNFWWVQLIVYSQLIVYKTQMSHLDTSNADTAQSKDKKILWVQLIVHFQLIVY